MTGEVAKMVENEGHMLSQINHPNVLKLHSYGSNAKFLSPYGITKDTMYVATEVAAGGDLFTFIRNSKGLGEDLTRYYFK